MALYAAGFGAGVLGGGLVGGLIRSAVPEHEAELYKGEIERGGILLGIYCIDNERAAEAHKLLEANSAEHVKSESVKDETVSNFSMRLSSTLSQTGEKRARETGLFHCLLAKRS